ncbi:hypothetical protein BN1708_007654, partial [Verticillium longisporum]
MSATTAKRLVVCGGNGFLGSRICKYAVQRGWDVTSVSRSGEPRWDTVTSSASPPSWSHKVAWERADILQPSTYAPLLKGADYVVLSRPQTVPPYVGPPVELPSDTGQRQYQSGYFAEQASPQHQHVQTSMPAHEVNGLPKADVAWVPHVSMAQVSPGHQRSATTTGVSPMHSPGLQPGQQQHLQQQYQQQQQQQRQQYSPATPGSEQSLSNGLPRDSNSAWSEGDGGMSPRHETYYHR